MELENFCITNDPAEGARRLEVLLEHADRAPPELRARAFRDYGGASQMAGDLERAERAYQESGRLFREAGYEAGEATIVFRLGVQALWLGDLERARRLYEESLQTFRASNVWRAIEAEESRRSMPRWAQSRELYAAHAPASVSTAEGMPLEEAASYALSLD